MYWNFRPVSNRSWGVSVHRLFLFLLLVWLAISFSTLPVCTQSCDTFACFASKPLNWSSNWSRGGSSGTPATPAIKAGCALQMTPAVLAAFFCAAELEALGRWAQKKGRGARVMISMGDCGRFWVPCCIFGLCITNKKLRHFFYINQTNSLTSVMISFRIFLWGRGLAVSQCRDLSDSFLPGLRPDDVFRRQMLLQTRAMCRGPASAENLQLSSWESPALWDDRSNT